MRSLVDGQDRGIHYALKSSGFDDRPEIRPGMILAEFDHVAALRLPQPSGENLTWYSRMEVRSGCRQWGSSITCCRSSPSTKRFIPPSPEHQDAKLSRQDVFTRPRWIAAIYPALSVAERHQASARAIAVLAILMSTAA